MVQKWKFQGGGGGDLSEIPSVVRVWIFSGITQWKLVSYSRIMKSICLNTYPEVEGFLYVAT